MLAHIVSGDVIVLCVMRGRPFTLRIASISSSGIAAKIALPTRTRAAARGCRNFTMVRIIISRHCTWSMNTASSAIRDARFAVSPDCSIQAAHVGWLCATKSPIHEARADRERLQADVPAAHLADLVDVAHLLQCREQAVRGGRRGCTRCARQ